MGEPAGIWVRVSTGGQDEASQVPDVEKHCAARGYDIAKRYTVHGKSASKGKHQADLDKMLADMKAGAIKVLVIWHSDRIERRPGKPHTSPLLDLLAEVAAAGGRVESVKEPMLGQLDMGSQVTTYMAGLINAEKSRHIAEQVGIAFDAIKANEALHGRPPFGYAVTGTKFAKTLVPTDDGKTYVPEIFARVTDGEPLKSIAAWLDGKGVKPPQGGQWWARSLSQIIRNPAYKGQRCEQDQRTKKHGKILSRHEALVDAARWRQANDALDSRLPGRPGGKGHVSGDPAMLSGVLYCPHCGSPMYRILCGGTRSARTGYYRCFGRGPQRRGCGNSLRCDRADAAVQQIAASTFHAPVMVTRVKPGHSYEAELEEIRDELVNLARLGLPWAEEDEKRAALRERHDDLSARETVPDEVVTEPSGQTYKELWDSLTDAQRGPWLKRHGFRVTASRTGIKLSQPGHPQQVTAAITF